MKKRIACLLLVFVMTAGILLLGAISAIAEENTTHITSQSDWSDFAARIANGDTFEGKTVVLDADIKTDKAIGEWAEDDTKRVFSGTFEGGGNTITFNNNDNTGNKGVFAYTVGAEISNLKVTGENEGNWSLGGIVGCAKSTKITNCENSATILWNENRDEHYAGGIVGVSEGNNVISGCKNSGTVSGNHCVGGIIGEARDNDIINNCVNEGSVSGNCDSVGGIVGNAKSNDTVLNCINEGGVSGRKYVGGIVGHSEGSKVVLENSINYGSVTVSAEGNYQGGIAGHMSSGGTVKNCFTAGVVLNTEFCGIIVGWASDTDFFLENCAYLILEDHDGIETVYNKSDVFASEIMAVETKTDTGMLAAMNEKAAENDGWYYWTASDEKAWLTATAPVYYSVVFHSYADTNPPASQKVKHGDKAERPSDPQKALHAFDGWYSDKELTVPFDFDTPITGPTALYAKWTRIYTVDFDINGGYMEVGILPQDIREGEQVTMPEKVPVRTGYTFNAWYIDKEASLSFDFDTPVTGDMTLYAGYNENEYNLSYAVGNGTGAPKTQYMGYTEEAYVSDVVPTQNGYTFKGWSTDKVSLTPQFQPGDLFKPKDAVPPCDVLYAVWEANIAEFNYVAGEGGTVSYKHETVSADGGSPNMPVGSVAMPSAGYRFSEWKDSSGKTVSVSAAFVPERAANGWYVSETYTAFFAPVVHTYSTEWSMSATHHWHACTCEDGDCRGFVSGFGEHSFDKGTVDGNVTTCTCSECGYKKYIYDISGDDEGEIVTGTTYTGISLTLGSDISINFYMDLTDEARQNGKMTFTVGGRTVTVDGKDAKWNSKEEKYYFSTPLTALEMAQPVKATFNYSGVEYVQEYSAAEYLAKIAENGTKYGIEAAALAKKIANYGFYAQIYLAGIHENVKIGTNGYAAVSKYPEADVDVTSAKKALAGYEVAVTGTSDNLSLFGCSVNFDAATALNYYITSKDGSLPAASCGGKNVTVTEYTDYQPKANEKVYIVSVRDIAAVELADDFTVTVDGEISITGSVLAYCNSVVSAHVFDGATAKDTSAVNAMAAFCEYYDAAVKYAESQVASYTVTFYSAPYCNPLCQTVKHGEKAHRPTDPMTANYVFDGWYEDEERTAPWDFDTPITEETTIYGKWILNEEFNEIAEEAKSHISDLVYNVVSKIDDLDLEEEIKQTYITEAHNARLTAEIRIENAKYTNEIENIVGEAENRIKEVLSIAENAVRTVYCVSFDMMGHGEQVSSQVVLKGDTAIKPADPAADGYEFDGWYTDDNFETPWDFDTPITENTDLYAKWAKKYTVSFDMMGHGTSPDSQTVKSGDKVTKPEDPAAEGRLFGGWYKDCTLQAAWNFNFDTVTEDITLYAKWTVSTPVLEDGYYLVGKINGVSIWTVSDITPDLKLDFSVTVPGEYTIDRTFVYGDEIKVAKVENGIITAWYNNGIENYRIEESEAGKGTLYFRPAGNPEWSYFYFTILPTDPPEQEDDTDYSVYCLCGTINGNEYGMTYFSNPQWSEPGEYVFGKDGTLTAVFTEDSYVQVKTLHGEWWYAFENFVQDGTPTTLYEANDTYRESMFVPGNTEVTFTLKKDATGALILGYVLE